MTPRELRKMRAQIAVDAIVRRDADVWDRYLDNQRLQKARARLPRQIQQTRQRLAQLEAEAQALGSAGMTITLPWPDRRMSPNARTHWAILAKVKKLARANACTLTTVAMPLSAKRAIAAGADRIPMTVRFYPPDARLRDDDNAVASFKASRDGIADAMGVDDRRFLPTYQFMPPEKPGRVEVAFQHNQEHGQ